MYLALSYKFVNCCYCDLMTLLLYFILSIFEEFLKTITLEKAPSSHNTHATQLFESPPRLILLETLIGGLLRFYGIIQPLIRSLIRYFLGDKYSFGVRSRPLQLQLRSQQSWRSHFGHSSLEEHRVVKSSSRI